MARLFSRPPSREYDDGWDAIFGQGPYVHPAEVQYAIDAGFSEKELEAMATDSVEEAVRNAAIYGTGVLRVTPDQDAPAPEPPVPAPAPAPDGVSEPDGDVPAGHLRLPGGGIRRPRGWKP
jgi:hypothetical protein